MRRFGRAGRSRRGGASAGAAPIAPDSIDALWAEYGHLALYWFDASGLNVGAQTVTSRVGGYVAAQYDASEYSCTLSLGSVGSCSSVVILPTGTDGGALHCDPGAANVARRRLVGMQRSADSVSFYDAISYVIDLQPFNRRSWYQSSLRQDLNPGGGTVAVVADGHAGPAASHYFRANGVAIAGSGFIVSFPGTAGFLEVYIPLEDPMLPAAFTMWAGFAHASLSDAQTIDIETRLMALMGITP